MPDVVPDKRVVVIATLYIITEGDARDRFIPVFQDFLAGVHTEPGMNHFTVSVNQDFTEYGIHEEYKDQTAFDESASSLFVIFEIRPLTTAPRHANSPHSAEFNRICKDPRNPIFRPERPPAVSAYTPFRPIPGVHINRGQ